jgi:hypothetical protein
MAQLDNLRRHNALKAALLQKIASASYRGFDLSAFMSSNQVRFENVYPCLLELETAGKIRRTGSEQSIRTKNGTVMFAMWEVVAEPVTLKGNRPDPDDLPRWDMATDAAWFEGVA